MSEDSSVAPVNESGTSGTGNESGEPEIRPSDLPDTASLKDVEACDAELPYKPPSEGEALVPPQCIGACLCVFHCAAVVVSVHACDFCIVGIYEFVGTSGETAEKTKVAVAGGGRPKKRPTKLSPSALWGKLLSQCSQVFFFFFFFASTVSYWG